MHAPPPMPEPREADDDLLAKALREALQPPATPPDAAAQALQARVLADWHARTRSAPAVLGGGGGAGSLGGWLHALPGWLGAAALAVLLSLGYTLWQRHGVDASVEELSQVDVLSQLAVGEM